jgi:hypothetical protein
VEILKGNTLGQKEMVCGDERKERTDNKFRRVQFFVVYRVLLRSHERGFDALTGPLLTELHLQNGVIDWLA